MRTLGWCLILILLAGCVPGYKYAPDRLAFSNVADLRATFERDLKQCGGSTQARGYVVPLIAWPLFMGAEVALRESVRSCMERNGWRVAPEADPLSGQQDMRVNGSLGNSTPRQVGEIAQ